MRKKIIVFQNDYSFLCWETDTISGSGIKTSSFNKKKKENILYMLDRM